MFNRLWGKTVEAIVPEYKEPQYRTVVTMVNGERFTLHGTLEKSQMNYKKFSEGLNDGANSTTIEWDDGEIWIIVYKNICSIVFEKVED